ncbi:MAG TPA: DUF2442 domain-containing protein [Geminicoccaceae bacterium]|nr:DUF2442 domain-containing protein [Geminicoccaceae bacterium]
MPRVLRWKGYRYERTLEIAGVECTDRKVLVSLKDGRKIVTPLWWYPRLRDATPEQRRRWEIAGAGRGIHWPDVDEDLSLEGTLRGSKVPGAKDPDSAS